jgi:hypothetical protein
MEIMKRLRPNNKWLLWMGVLVASTLIILGVSVAFMGSDDEKSGVAKINAVKAPLKKATVGGKPKTEDYNIKVKEKDRLLAEQAQKEGKSVMPTVLGEGIRPNVKKVEPEKPKAVPDTKRPPKRKSGHLNPQGEDIKSPRILKNIKPHWPKISVGP